MSRTAITAARENARKIRDLLESADGGHADLYRTIEAGPSGQRRDLLVGRVRYLMDGPYEFEIVDVTSPYNHGDRAGFARLDGGRWSITRLTYDGAHEWLGWASSLSVGIDVLINGTHAALGRHDSRRISSGSFTPQAVWAHPARAGAKASTALMRAQKPFPRHAPDTKPAPDSEPS